MYILVCVGTVVSLSTIVIFNDKSAYYSSYDDVGRVSKVQAENSGCTHRFVFTEMH